MDRAGHTVLVVSDESRERDDMVDALKKAGYQVQCVATTEAALDTARKRKPSVALIDLWLADLPGHVVLHGVRQASPATECIAVMTSPAQQDGAYEAIKLGAFTFLRRAYDNRHLLNMVQRAIEKHESAHALEEVKQRLTLLFDALPVGVLIVDDRTGSVVDANPAAVRYMGAPKEEIVGAILQARALGSPDPAAKTGEGAAARDPAGALRQAGKRIPATRAVTSMLIGARRHRVECFVDITGRLDVEDQLAAASSLNRALLEDVRDLVVSVDARGHVLRVFQNPGAADAAPQPEQDLSALLPIACRDRYRQVLHDVLHTGRSATFSVGNPPFEAWSVRVDPVQSRGEMLAAVVRVRDLSELGRVAQRQLVRDVIVTHSREAALVLNTEGVIVDANAAVVDLLEYQMVELIGMGIQQLDHPEQPRPWARVWAAAAAQGQTDLATQFKTRGGRLLPLTLSIFHVVLNGTAHAVAYLFDQSPGRRMAQAAAGVEERERSLLAAVGDPAWVLDRAGTVRNLNEAAAALCGQAGTTAVGEKYERLVRGGLAVGRLACVEDAFRRGHALTIEDRADSQCFRVTATPLRETTGAVVAVVLVSHDLTAERERDTQLARVWASGQEGLMELDLSALPGLAASGDAVRDRLMAVRIVRVNPAAAAFFQRTAESLSSEGLAGLAAADSGRALADALARVVAGPELSCAWEQAFAVAGSGGGAIHASLRLVARSETMGPPQRATLCLMDRTACVVSLREILDTSTQERARVGNDLQAALAGPLAASAATAERLRAALAGGDTALAAEADGLAAQLGELKLRAAQVAASLADATGSDIGLMAAMSRLADEAAARWGVACRCNVRTAGLSHDRALAVHLLGIAREAVDEAVRVRGARELWITVTANAREGLLTVKDTVATGAVPDGADGVAVVPPPPRLMRIHADLIQGLLESERDVRGTHTRTCRFPITP